MSGDPGIDVDALRRSYDAFSRRDFDQAGALHDDEIEWVDPPVLPDAATHRGKAQVKERWEVFGELFEEFRVEPLEMIPSGDSVFAAVRLTARGRESGAGVTVDYFQVWVFREGRVVRQLAFVDRGQALDAAGIHG